MITVKLRSHNLFIWQIFVLATSAEVLRNQTRVVQLVSHLETVSGKGKVTDNSITVPFPLRCQ